MRDIACPNNGATESCFTFDGKSSLFQGIVLVTIHSSIGAVFKRSIAGPERTACVAPTYTAFAPLLQT